MEKNCFTWPKLHAGDLVHIIAPASAAQDSKLQRGIEWLKLKGFEVEVPVNLIQEDLFFAAPLEHQLELFKAALFSDAQALWCLRGGYGSMRLLPYLQHIKPPEKPKLLIGFSDITSLHVFFNQIWNWPTLHTRTITQLSPDWEMGKEQQLLLDVLHGNIQAVNFPNLIPLNKHALREKLITAPVVGGNLRLLQSSLATPFSINPKGKILFIEDISERGYEVDRMLEQMLQSGILGGVKAMVIGDFSEGLEKNGIDLVPQALARFAESVDFPVLKGMPCGHGKNENYPLPLNTEANLYLGKKAEMVVHLKI